MSTATSTVTGTLNVHYRGFGFVEHPNGSAYVPAQLIDGLIDGDTVEATVKGDNVTKLRLTRRTRCRAIGEVTRDNNRWHVTVDRALGNLVIPIAHTRGLIEGTSVEIELPDKHQRYGRLIEILGDPTSAVALNRRCLSRWQIAADHPAEALKAAEQLAGQRNRRNRHRRDLRDMTTITIDADHSQDLDDAISTMPARDGAIRVFVHISDVTEHITEGSVLDRAAKAQPTSVYLNDYTRHMLPNSISAAWLSLLPGQDRDTLTVELVINSDGTVRSTDVYESLIRSRMRLNYDQAASIISGTPPSGLDSTLIDQVTLAWAAAARLSLQRTARGGLDAWRGDGERPGNNDAHLMIERLMVAANEAVARWLTERDMPVLYRTHPAMSDEQAAELETVAGALGMYAALPRPVTPQALAALATQAASMKTADRFWDAVMKVLPSASYRHEQAMHFGLGSDCYVHFTSPIRRYADMIVHRSIKAYLAGERNHDQTWDELEPLAAAITDATIAAARAERDAERAHAISRLSENTQTEAVVLSSSGNNSRVLIGNTIGILTKHTARAGARITVTIVHADPLTGRLEVTHTPGEAARRATSNKTAGTKVTATSLVNTDAEPVTETENPPATTPARRRNRRRTVNGAGHDRTNDTTAKAAGGTTQPTRPANTPEPPESTATEATTPGDSGRPSRRSRTRRGRNSTTSSAATD